MSKEKKTQKKTGHPSWLKKVELAGVIGLVALLYYHARNFEFIQDDSFITFRYVKNFIAGNGLVFNIGERVEGYTTFLWTVLLAVLGKLGFDIISLSQWLGILFGLGTIYIVYRLSIQFSLEQRAFGFSLIAGLLLACNSAVAYWMISGMETGMFMFQMTVSIFLYIKERNQQKLFAYAPISFMLLSLTRPEGMYVFGLSMIFFVAEIFIDKTKDKKIEFKRLVLWCALYGIPIAIFMMWRLSYYGWLFPNTYYAKAGFSKDYFLAGVDYFWDFAQNDLLWGGLLVVPVLILLWRKRTPEILYLIFLVLSYSAYVVSVGGDVLPNFRFFVAMLPLMYILVQECLFELYTLFKENKSILSNVIYAAPLIIGYVTYSIPFDHVKRFCDLENGLVEKMKEQGEWLKAHSQPNAVIAATTIGAVSYYSELTLIDMLGLTDETIAHHPEKLEDLQSGWKERHHNATYVLGRKPDWILFSTGYKPSAYAERALFTKKEFRQMYYQYYFHPGGDERSVGIIYKRAAQPYSDSGLVESHPVKNQFVNDYYDGVNRISRWPIDALKFFQKSESEAPPDFAMLYEAIAETYSVLKDTGRANKYYRLAVTTDRRLIESNQVLGMNALQSGDTQTALQYLEPIVTMNPDYFYGWIYYGRALMVSGDMVRAQVAFKNALQISPNNPELQNMLQQLSGKG